MIDETQVIKVNVTLTSLETNNNIAVINKDKDGFTAKELNSGLSNATFDWFVVAKRKIADPFIEEIISGDSGSIAETPIETETSTISETETIEPAVETPTSSEAVVASPLTEPSSGDGETPPSESVVENPPAEQPTEDPPVEPIIETPIE